MIDRSLFFPLRDAAQPLAALMRAPYAMRR
jgi:hypothetical protein